MENKREIFAIGVDQARKNKNWSQKKLASKIMGGNQGTISSWLRGRTKFPEERFEEFASVFNTTIADLLQVGREEQTKQAANSTKTIFNEVVSDSMGLEENNNVFKLNDSLEAEYLSLIRQFKNKYMVRTITRQLVELEALDDTAFAEIIVEIKNKIKEAQTLKKRPRANGEG